MLYKEANTLVAKSFNNGYFHLHDYVYTVGDVIHSRNGDTREILNFKTQLTNPLHRCVAGYNRNVNIFFLMAESMWIFKGRRDLEFLEIFNKQMREYSDDGKYFNGAYGWRLRRQGVEPTIDFESSNIHALNVGRDQLKEALQMLENNPADRRVVLSLWNPDFDFNRNSKDVCCNDMLMYKIRNGELHQTIQNRSNDLNWGLTTNVFQFSYIGEIMAAVLNVGYATQTHNSQSLHLYTNQPLTVSLQDQFQKSDYELFQKGFLNHIDLYGICRPLPIQFKFREEGLSVAKKLFWVDFYLHAIILKLLNLNKENPMRDEDDENLFDEELKTFCYQFWITYKMLKIYVLYKKHKDHRQAINDLLKLNADTGIAVYDFFLLGLNFFLQRIKAKEGKVGFRDESEFKEVLEMIHHLIPSYKALYVGDL